MQFHLEIVCEVVWTEVAALPVQRCLSELGYELSDVYDYDRLGQMALAHNMI